MMIAGIVCDSGGADGSTDNAYSYARALAADQNHRFRLVKGDHRKNMPIVESRMPDSSRRRDRNAISRGQVPVLFLDVNRLKNRLDGDLARSEPGTGYVEFPDWLPYRFYDGLTREKKNEKGVWVGASGNEPWDLLVYAEAAAIFGVPFGLKIKGVDLPKFWENPPNWARAQAENFYVVDLNSGKDENVLVAMPKSNKKPFVRRSSGPFFKGRR